MEREVFINEAITVSIGNYLDSKDTPDSEMFNSFLVVVIRALVLIYGELDILNPFRTGNENGFNANLKKYGLKDSKITDFKEQLLVYWKSDENNKKNSFIKIQRILVDMFVAKRGTVIISDEDVILFKSLLYIKEDENKFKLELYKKYTDGSNEIINYFNGKMFELKHNYVFTEFKDTTLDPEAYRLAGYNIVEIMKMQNKEIENINNKVYHFFRIKDTDLNKKERLESAVNYYKKYGNAITSGNGYVDMLLLIGVVATVLMVITIVGINFMR